MVRPVRHKKPVNYSTFEDSDSDDDFVSATGPLNKKSRTTPKDLKLEKPKPKLKNLQKEAILLQEKTPKKRMALDDKLYQRNLGVALALSAKELPTVVTDVEESQDKGPENHGNSEIETMDKSPCVSNCSVASDYLDLDRAHEEDDSCGAQGKRKTASPAVVQQRKVLLEGSDGNSVHDSEPDFTTSADSEDDSDFSESEDNEEEFTVRKRKGSKKKEVKAKPPAAKREKKPKPRCPALVESVPAAVKSEPQPSPSRASSDATRQPWPRRHPPAESRRPAWAPPAAAGSRSGSGSNGSSPLAGVGVKSPNQSLRLGLSRFARIKPLHPNAASS